MAVFQSKWGLRGGTPGTSGGDRLSEVLTGHPLSAEDTSLLQYLKDLAVTGGQKLDDILRAVAETAQRRTGASGAAVAMWRDGAMVCRARSGMTAPPLGAELSTDSGISGECLRTGQNQYCADTEMDSRVDVEVCRSLRLRSIAVLPVQGWRGINGILEVFSTEPRAFSDDHLAFLQQLTAVAERARTFQPQGATATAKTPVEEPEAQGILPASDRVRDVAAIYFGRRSRPFVIAGAVLAIFFIGVAIWLGWRGPADGNSISQSDPSLVSKVEAARPPAGDSTWKENPGGEVLSPRASPTGNPVKQASSLKVLPPPKTRPDQPLLSADAAAMSVLPHHLPSVPVEEAIVVEPPSLPTFGSGSAELGTPSDSSVTPEVSKQASSQNVAPGHLAHRVTPTYPQQALLLRLQGKVILEATVYEDGTVHDLSVLQGQSVLAQAAVAAVERWRYKPYQLNGKPVKRKTTIAVDFKLPENTSSR